MRATLKIGQKYTSPPLHIDKKVVKIGQKVAFLSLFALVFKSNLIISKKVRKFVSTKQSNKQTNLNTNI